MARKKKPSRKYTPRNEFRINYGPRAQDHPHYIFGETKTKYKSLGLTTEPKLEHPSTKLKRNPNPVDSSDSFLQFKVHTDKKEYYGKPLSGWSFSADDMPVVRHRIKKYKRAMNRKPPMWYEKKKRKKK